MRQWRVIMDVIHDKKNIAVGHRSKFIIESSAIGVVRVVQPRWAVDVWLILFLG